MKTKTNFKKGAALMAALIVTGAVTAPVFAAEGVKYTELTGGKVAVEKYLIMDEEASVPNVTFKYSIAPGVAQNSDGSTTSQVHAGEAGATIGTAVFAEGDQTFTEAQALPNTLGTQHVADAKDNVTLDAGQKYARHDVAVDFSAVTFTEPGVYRYIITETASDTSLGIVDDTDSTRVMDVYVEDDATGKLKISGYVLHNAADNSTVKQDGTYSNKAEGFVNSYVTHDLTIAQKVNGNQASRDEYFKYSVAITGGIDNTVYEVNLSNADATTKTNKFNTAAHKNAPALRKTATGLEVGKIVDGAFVADPSLGEVEGGKAVFYLQNGQDITILGLANNTAYSVVADAVALDHAGYDPSAVITGDTSSAGADIEMDAATYEVKDDHITADTTVEYSNAKQGVIPTGIMNSVGMGAITSVVAATGIGMYVILSKRKEEDEENN